jgi:metallo-beta-lactamase family protein
MAIHTTHLVERYPAEHRLSAKQVRALTHCATMVNTPDQSKALACRHGPMVILAASGMATGGRVLHHLALYASDHRNMIILTGFQAPGTRGATLANGASSVRIHGRDVSVNAEVVQLQSASAHADARQLLAWLHTLPESPAQVYIVHGERGPSDELRKRIKHELGWRAMVPEHGSTWPT